MINNPKIEYGNSISSCVWLELNKVEEQQKRNRMLNWYLIQPKYINQANDVPITLDDINLLLHKRFMSIEEYLQIYLDNPQIELDSE